MSAAADTLGVGVGLRVLELFEPRVDLERLGDGSSASWGRDKLRRFIPIAVVSVIFLIAADVIVAEAADASGTNVSAAADTLPN